MITTSQLSLATEKAVHHCPVVVPISDDQFFDGELSMFILAKVCTKCGINKVVQDYHARPEGRYGKRADCKECHSKKAHAHYEVNKERILKKNREWEINNSERHKASKKKYRELHNDKFKKWNREYYARYPERMKARRDASRSRPEVQQQRNNYNKKYHEEHRLDRLEKGAKWRDENRESFRETQRAWRKANPDAHNESRAKRRAIKLNAKPKWYEKDDVTSIYRTARCMSVGGDRYHVDHIVPLVHPLVCGLHCKDNMQIITAEKNYKKNNYFEISI